MIITKEQIDFLRPYIPKIDELANEETDDALLDELDALIIGELDDAQNELSPLGVRFQLMYDAIFGAND